MAENQDKKQSPFEYYSNIGEMIKIKAEREGKSIPALVTTNLLRTLAMTIPGFIVVLLFPIHAEESYGWFSGVWQGWFGLCNMIIRIFSPDTLYCAPLGTSGYNVCWWIFFVFGVLALLGFFEAMLMSQSHEDHHFVNPNEQEPVEIDENSGITADELSSSTSIKQRVIKVFISSTFNDMMKERDYLMHNTFPELKLIAAKRNVTFIPIDLRWGITKEESESGKVMELCFQEIDKAIPFFIGIIGKRYGWTPPIEHFKNSQYLREKHPWVENDIRQGMSMTEMEIQYGVLRRKERMNAAFFTTDGTLNSALSVDNDTRGRIAKLKRAIITDGRYPIINSFTPEELGLKVKRMFEQFLEQYFPEIPDDMSAQDVQPVITDLQPKSEHDLRQFIGEYLMRFGKKLSDAQMDAIVAHPPFMNTTVLKTVLDELILCGDFDHLDNYIAELLKTKTPADMYQKVLERYEKQYGKSQVRNFFSAVALTYYGLKSKDLVQIADIDFKSLEVSISTFMKDIKNVKFQYERLEDYFQEYLKVEDGYISLSHPQMREAVEKRYLSDEKAVNKCRKKIIEQLKMHVGIFKVSDKCKGNVEEIARQYQMIGKKSALKDFLEDDVPKAYLKKNQPELYKTLLEEATAS